MPEILGVLQTDGDAVVWGCLRCSVVRLFNEGGDEVGDLSSSFDGGKVIGVVRPGKKDCWLGLWHLVHNVPAKVDEILVRC